MEKFPILESCLFFVLLQCLHYIVRSLANSTYHLQLISVICTLFFPSLIFMTLLFELGVCDDSVNNFMTSFRYFSCIAWTGIEAFQGIHTDAGVSRVKSQDLEIRLFNCELHYMVLEKSYISPLLSPWLGFC
jgi:hypothetical protein